MQSENYRSYRGVGVMLTAAALGLALGGAIGMAAFLYTHDPLEVWE